jgi:hypothetical protein
VVFGKWSGNLISNANKLHGFGGAMVDYRFCLVGHYNAIRIPLQQCLVCYPSIRIQY